MGSSAARSAIAADARAEAAGFGIGKKNAEMNAEITRAYFRLARRYPEDLDLLKRNRDLGIGRMNVRLPPSKADEILPLLDCWAKLIPQLRP